MESPPTIFPLAPLQLDNMEDGILMEDLHSYRQYSNDIEELRDHDPTPKTQFDPWRNSGLTPAIMDPNSFAFHSFANQQPGYYTLTPGGASTLYHSQAGDLHTPGMGMNMIGTHVSMPISGDHLHADSTVDLQSFHPQLLQPHLFSNPFAHAPQQQGFAPSSFVHPDSGYVEPHADSPFQNIKMDTTRSQESLPTDAFIRPPQGSMTSLPLLQSEKFRYQVTLNAPTAMIKTVEEIPITYLNKGQAYSISIVDTAPPAALNPGVVKYRTYIRVSFEDEQQRSRPSACWQLWKEGRGTNEAHHRGGKLLAVEYVDPNQGGDEETRRPQIELESASFDGFCITWTPNPATGAADCSVAVRFNFLSTDFSHSKGVKGIPVRLCAKTSLISADEPAAPTGNAEVCYCMVKLFRDHGAERKLSNDVAHVKKTIEKLNQQIAQASAGTGNHGKRKRSESIIGNASGGNKNGKTSKHKRAWSTSSGNDQGSRLSVEEDLHMKLATIQDMFSSTRPVSVLYLNGDERDDPDLHPVQLGGEPQDLAMLETESLTRQTTWESKPSTETTSVASNIVSPTSSSASVPTPTRFRDRRRSSVQQPAASSLSPPSSSDWTLPQTLRSTGKQLQPAASVRPTKVQRFVGGGSTASEAWLDALDVDVTYQSTPEHRIKPAACFYVLIKSMSTNGDGYYRAVYLMQRAVQDLVSSISSKCDVDSSRITRITHINSSGLQIIVDEDVVRELPEGQDMIVEFAETDDRQSGKYEWETETLEVMVDGDLEIVETSTTSKLEMKLIF